MPASFETPSVEPRVLAHLVREKYGLPLIASPLPGEWDLNVLMSGPDGPAAVLKVSHAGQDRIWLETEHAVLDRMAEQLPEVAFPRVLRTLANEAIVSLEGHDGARYFARLLSIVPGKLYTKVRPHDRKLLRSLGRCLALVGRTLAGFRAPILRRTLKWDLSQARRIEAELEVISEGPRRECVGRIIEAFRLEVEPRIAYLRHQAIYNDANDHNILVSQGEVTGFIDLGDMVETALVHDVAVAAAYALMGQASPLDAACELVAAYHKELPLTEEEIGLIWTLIQTRLAVSVVNAAVQQIERPGNRYLTVSQAPAWELLERMAAVHPRLAIYALRAACGLPSHPHSPEVVSWLRANTNSFASILSIDLRRTPSVQLDWSVGSLDLGGGDAWSSEQLLAHLARERQAKGADLAIGRYLEPRLIPTSDRFREPGLERSERLTIHLGVDLFLPAGAPVFAPLAGRVHSVRDDGIEAADSAPTVILAHQAGSGGRPFYTLYRYLDSGCLTALQPGTEIPAGAPLGSFGRTGGHGRCPPHLHFQILLDPLDGGCDFPEAARPGASALYEGLCPDPNAILGVAGGVFAGHEGMASILAQRTRTTGPSLSVSYDEPLHIVRGFMQNLFDAEGQVYLDMVNNVPHVGHANPRVVEAAARQLALLNTNTRYLSRLLGRYAERLIETLPPELSVCFFVNSGSEANELALRLARTATGRKGTVVVDAAYHGNTTSLIDVSPYKHEGPGGQGPPEWVRKIALPDSYRGCFRGPNTGPSYGALVRDAMDALETAGNPVAAFMAESMLGCGGQVVLPEGYLQEAYRGIRARGGVCIADEVQVGFGRPGSHFWAFEHQGVVPDIVTLGKPIGNGWPLGAVVTTPEIARAFANGMEYFNTFGGNQASLAVGLAVLDEIQQRGLQTNALRVGNRIMEGLRLLQQRHDVIGDVRGLGLYIGAELVRDRSTKKPFAEAATYVANRLRRFGVLISTDGPDHNVLKIKPPMVVNDSDADSLLEALDRALSEDGAHR